MPIKSEVAQLLLHCPDKPGILAEVTDFITVNKGNIVYLAHPAVWYTAEGGISALDIMLQDLESELLG